jgi:carbonic anhydrase/acetyltransferase-like protein (isoleucine patch superfamily)
MKKNTKNTNNKNIIHNPKTSWNKTSAFPQIDSTACAHSSVVLIGDVHIGKHVNIAPHASIRADEGSPIMIGNYSNIQDSV